MKLGHGYRFGGPFSTYVQTHEPAGASERDVQAELVTAEPVDAASAEHLKERKSPFVRRMAAEECWRFRISPHSP